jgi:hypothetical protein
MSLWQALLTLVGIASAIGIIGMIARWLRGESMLRGFALGFGATIGVLALIVFYQIARARVQRALLRNENRDLALARRSAGLDGGVLRRDALTLWTSGPKDWSPDVLGQLEEARTRFAAFVGESAPSDDALRLLLFAERKWFDQYARGAQLVIPSGLDGFYLAGAPTKIVVAMPNPYLRLAQPDRLLRILFGYHFLKGYLGFFAHSWLYLGVGGLISRDPTPGEQARLNRRMRADFLRPDGALPAQELFKPVPKIIFRSARTAGAHAEYAGRISVFVHASSLLDYLAGFDAPRERIEPFRLFLKDLKRRDKYDIVFRRHFGHGLDEMYNNWREWVLAKGVGDHEPPPAVLREALIDIVIPLVSDRSAKREDRIQAIRDMGNTGYTLGADALIDLLRERDRELRATAVWALEAISGTVGGDDVAHWEDWWDDLPQDAVLANGDELAPESRLIRKES